MRAGVLLTYTLLVTAGTSAKAACPAVSGLQDTGDRHFRLMLGHAAKCLGLHVGTHCELTLYAQGLIDIQHVKHAHPYWTLHT